MKSIYSFLLFFACLLFIATDLKSQNATSQLAVHAVCRGTYNFPRSHKPHRPPYYYLFDIKLANESTEFNKFLTLTCTPMDNVVTDSKDYRVCSPVCPGNTIRPITLNPGQEFSISIILEASSDRTNDSIKIGWIYLNYENTQNVDDFFIKLGKAHINNNNVIWSSMINIDKFYNEQIEIQ